VKNRPPMPSAIDFERRPISSPPVEPAQSYSSGRYKTRSYEKSPQDFEEVWFTAAMANIGAAIRNRQKRSSPKIPARMPVRAKRWAAGILGDESRCFELLTHGTQARPPRWPRADLAP